MNYTYEYLYNCFNHSSFLNINSKNVRIRFGRPLLKGAKPGASYSVWLEYKLVKDFHHKVKIILVYDIYEIMLVIFNEYKIHYKNIK